MSLERAALILHGAQGLVSSHALSETAVHGVASSRRGITARAPRPAIASWHPRVWWAPSAVTLPVSRSAGIWPGGSGSTDASPIWRPSTGSLGPVAFAGEPSTARPSSVSSSIPRSTARRPLVQRRAIPCRSMDAPFRAIVIAGVPPAFALGRCRPLHVRASRRDVPPVSGDPRPLVIGLPVPGLVDRACSFAHGYQRPCRSHEMSPSTGLSDETHSGHRSSRTTICKCQRSGKVAHPRGFEPLASAFGGRRSIQLSYGCPRGGIATIGGRRKSLRKMVEESAGRAEPRRRAISAEALHGEL